MKKFWRWVQNKAPDDDKPQGEEERTLFLEGAIAEDDPWFDDDVTPAVFKEELGDGSGPITLWINSPGGDVFAAAQIYNMLLSYKGKITVKIDGIAASAASVIAMAGDRVLVSPVSMLMIHNPSTLAMGNRTDMEKAISMLDEIKESIINAYMNKTKLSRRRLSDLMDAETWMNAKKAVELGFADAVMTRADLEGSGAENIFSEKSNPDTTQKGNNEKESGEKSGENLEEGPEEKSEGKPEEKSEGSDKNGTEEAHDKIGTGYLFQTRQLAAAFLNKVERHIAKDESQKPKPAKKNLEEKVPQTPTDNPDVSDTSDPTGTGVGSTEENPENGEELIPADPADGKNPSKSTGKDGTRRVEDLMARLDLIHSLM